LYHVKRGLGRDGLQRCFVPLDESKRLILATWTENFPDLKAAATRLKQGIKGVEDVRDVLLVLLKTSVGQADE
jgi:hypothetical protein